MPVSTTNAISGPLLTNGITTIFPFTFTAPSTSEVQVISRLIATGAEAIVDPADYTVGLTIGGGGTVTFGTAPASGAELFIKLNPLFTQDVEFADGAPIRAASLNTMGDRSAARDQFLRAAMDRALLAPLGDSLGQIPLDRAGKYLAFDVDGDPVAAGGTGDDGSIRSDLAASGGSLLLGWIQAGANAVLRTVYAKLREVVSPEDFTGTDTAKFNAALATGKSVRCSATSYAITGALSPTADGQVIDLNGALLTCTGNFDLFNVTGLQGVVIGNGRIEAAAMTGGDILNVVNADRITFENMLVFNPFNFAFVQKANVVEINNVWVNNTRGAYGIRWLGDAANRSDVLRLIGVVMSFPDTGIGIDWDGNCHTLQAFGVIIVRPNKGLVIRNTAGATAPEFGFMVNLEIDFPVSHGVEILAGESYYFGPQFYCHGSTTGSGVVIASGLAPDRIQFAGGKISGNAAYGIDNNSRVAVSNLLMDGNATANFRDNDAAVLSTPRFEIDPTFLLRQDAGGNAYIDFDAGDGIAFARSGNDMLFNIGGATAVVIAGDRVQYTQPPQLPAVTVGSLPAAAAGNAGREYYVTDAIGTTRLSAAVGGGSNFVKVFSNGANWLIA